MCTKATAQCHACGETVIVVLDLHYIDLRLARIEQAITIEGVTMSEIDDRLAQLTVEIGDAAAAMAGAVADVDRVLADLRASLSGKLTAEEAAQFDALDAGLAAQTAAANAIKAAIDTADPVPAAPVEPIV